ncbi:MAG TPA: TolC family protein [Blastocatellia bacterium]|nr:TolC family protein [Blastocatellia bacterium]
MKRSIPRILASCVLLLACTFNLLSQTTALEQVSLDKAIDVAMNNYPAIRATKAQAAAATAGIDLARTAYLPKADLLWQENRATRNNIFGLLLPQSIIPAISGPVLGTNNSASGWGTAGGTLVTWEPFDFGLRKANVDLARAQTKQAEASVEITRLDVETAVVDAYLALIAAQEAVRAAQANVDRLQVFAKSVQVLVDNQLRPGVDSSRAEAELASARNFLIQAEQTVDIARTNLAEAMGVTGTRVSVEQGPFLDLPLDNVLPEINISLHPLAISQNAAIGIVQAREQVLRHSYFPKFYLQSAFYARGTADLLNGQIDNSKGWYPNVVNWASGVQITFPTLDIFSIRARRKVETNNEVAERARYDQTVQTIKAQELRARSEVEGARRIAANTPVQLKAAQETQIRATARYQADLTNVVEVAEAQRLLTQAEIEDAVARLKVWRALLFEAKARGDLKPFLQQVTTASIQRSK